MGNITVLSRLSGTQKQIGSKTTPFAISDAELVNDEKLHAEIVRKVYADEVSALSDNGQILSPSVIASRSYNGQPGFERWVPTDVLTYGRGGAGIAALLNGKAVIAGGLLTMNEVFGAPATLTDTAELFDHVTGTWTLTGSLASLRSACNMQPLPGNKALIMGGAKLPSPAGPSFINPDVQIGFNNRTCEIYDGNTGTWSAAASLPSSGSAYAPFSPERYSVVIKGGTCDGHVLVAGAQGSVNDADLSWVPAWAPTTAYAAGAPFSPGDIVTNDSGKFYTCITAGTSAGSGGPTGTGADITDGTAHWQYTRGAGTGGMTDTALDHVFGVPHVLRYNPTANTWTVCAPLNLGRGNSPMVAIGGGRVMILGGADANFAGTPTCEIYDSTNNVWTTVAPLPTSCAVDVAAGMSPTDDTYLQPGVCLVEDGKKVLVVGGESAISFQDRKGMVLYTLPTTYVAGVPTTLGSWAKLDGTGQQLVQGTGYGTFAFPVSKKNVLVAGGETNLPDFSNWVTNDVSTIVSELNYKARVAKDFPPASPAAGEPPALNGSNGFQQCQLSTGDVLWAGSFPGSTYNDIFFGDRVCRNGSYIWEVGAPVQGNASRAVLHDTGPVISPTQRTQAKDQKHKI